MYKIICLVIYLAISLAADVTVYIGRNTEPVKITEFPLKFTYDFDCVMKLFIKNISPSVTVVNVTYETDGETYNAENKIEQYGSRKHQKYYMFGPVNRSTVKFLKIKLHLYTSKNGYSSVLVAEGKDHSKLTNEETKEFARFDYCRSKSYKLEVDLGNFCDDSPSATDTEIKPGHDFTLNSTMSQSEHLETTTQYSTTADDKDLLASPPKHVVIICMIVTFLIILVIIICVKKYCRRKSEPADTMEMNTYVTTNEVVYADLSLANGDSQQPKRGEESPYAQIIGVLRPVDENVKTK